MITLVLVLRHSIESRSNNNNNNNNKEEGGRGMRSVEEKYKMINIESSINLYGNDDSTMSLVRAFEENAAHQGHQSLVKEARTFAE